MKTLRLLTTSLLIAVCAGFSSCGDEELEEFQLDEMYSTGDSFSTYGLNIKDYECRGSFYFGNINHFSGLKNNHLWISFMIGLPKRNFGNGLIVELLTRNVQFMLDMENIRILKYQALPPMELAPRTIYLLQALATVVNHTENIIYCLRLQRVISKR